MVVISMETPGVYVTETDPLWRPAVAQPTAVPVFIGYTESASVAGEDVRLTTQNIASLAQFEHVFGGMAVTVFGLDPATKRVVPPDRPAPALYPSVKGFFANGGGMCYVVSVGGYLDHAKGVSLAALTKGLEVAGRGGGVTLTVIPEAVQLPSLKDFGALAEAALAQAAELADRMVLLDVYGMEAVDPSADTWQSDFADVIAAFRKSISSDHLQYGASYTPSLKTSVIAPQGVDYKAFDPAALTQLLTAEAAELYDGAKLAAAKALIAEMPEASGKARVALAQNLRDMLPVQADLEQQVVDVLGVLPPSGLVAGMFVQNDAERGV